MPSLRFHEAARDGILGILKEATEKDCNTGDDDGMTPLHWAAFCGHLLAVKLLIGRGGKPGKIDNSGNTTLHHAAAGGHLKVVTFLVTFGESVWELNSSFHSPKVVAARLGRDEVLRYLDAYMGREMASNRKRTLRREERALKRAEERFPSSRSMSSSSESSCIHPAATATPSVSVAPSEAPVSRRSSAYTITGSALNLNRRWSMISSSSKLSRWTLSRGNSEESDVQSRDGGESAVSPSVVDGTQENRGRQLWEKLRTKKSPVVKKMKKKREEEARNGKILKRQNTTDIKLEDSILWGPVNYSDSQTRSMSQPDIMSITDMTRSVVSFEGLEEQLGSDGEDEVFQNQSTSMFERPGFGKVAFRQKSIILPASAKTVFGMLQHDIRKRARSLGGVGESMLVDGDLEDEDEEMTPLDSFLKVWGLTREGPALHRAGFKLETLMEANEDDFRVAGILLGPRKKLMSAIEKRREIIASPPKTIVVSRL